MQKTKWSRESLRLALNMLSATVGLAFLHVPLDDLLYPHRTVRDQREKEARKKTSEQKRHDVQHVEDVYIRPHILDSKSNHQLITTITTTSIFTSTTPLTLTTSNRSFDPNNNFNMQFFITILSLAVAVSAIPQGNGNGNTICKGGNERAVCCASKDALVGALECVTLPISVQQPGCDGSIRCCDIGDQKDVSQPLSRSPPSTHTNLQHQQGIVNVNALNCASVA